MNQLYLHLFSNSYNEYLIEVEGKVQDCLSYIQDSHIEDEITNINGLKEIRCLKETIGWRSYGQLDPLIEYKNEASNLYLETISEIKYNSVYNFLKIQIQI